MGLTSTSILNNIKAALNFNPQFDDAEILPLINKAIRRLAIRTDFAKEIYRVQITDTSVFNYVLDDTKASRILGVWYGQEDISTLQQIREGYQKLNKTDRRNLGIMNSAGYWEVPVTNNSVPYHKEIRLTFTPTANYWLVFEYTTWEEIPDTAYDTETDLNLYIPEDIHDMVEEWVVGQLKLRDRDNTAGVHLRQYRDDEKDLSDIHQSEVSHIDCDD